MPSRTQARCAPSVGAAGEQHVEAELGDVLELALGGGVVDRDVGVIDEAEQRVAVELVVADGDGEGLGRQERRGDRGEPLPELVDDRADEATAVDSEVIADEAASLGVVLGDVYCGDERAALGGEIGTGGLGVAELAATVRIAAGLDDAAG